MGCKKDILTDKGYKHTMSEKKTNIDEMEKGYGKRSGKRLFPLPGPQVSALGRSVPDMIGHEEMLFPVASGQHVVRDADLAGT